MIGPAVRRVFERALQATGGEYAMVTARLLERTVQLMEAEGTINIPRRDTPVPLGKLH
jgi:hypothetical protein